MDVLYKIRRGRTGFQFMANKQFRREKYWEHQCALIFHYMLSKTNMFNFYMNKTLFYDIFFYLGFWIKFGSRLILKKKSFFSSINIFKLPFKRPGGLFATGEIRRNIKFAAFWCVFLTKNKVDTESWWRILTVKQLRKKKIPKDNLTISKI